MHKANLALSSSPFARHTLTTAAACCEGTSTTPCRCARCTSTRRWPATTTSSAISLYLPQEVEQKWVSGRQGAGTVSVALPAPHATRNTGNAAAAGEIVQSVVTRGRATAVLTRCS